MIANRIISSAGRHLLTRRQMIPLHHFSTTASTLNIFDKITFIGTGKMSQALLSPLVKQGHQTPESIRAYDVSDKALSTVEELYPGVQTASSIPEAIDDSNLIVYGVKPQNLENVHAEIRRAKQENIGIVRDDAIILSVVAGAPIQSFIDGSLVPKICRTMPNTPAQIGAGVTVYSCTDNINTGERQKIKQVLRTFGETVCVEDESFIDMSTSISGSGPAYIFLLMESMIDAGVHMGFSRDVATTLVHHTLLGSTKFAMESKEHPAVLRNSVTSPAGTTASAIYELENGKFRTVIKDAIWACYRRSLEMGGQCSQVGPNRAAAPLIPTDEASPNSNNNPSSHHPVEPPTGEMSVQSSFGNSNKYHP